LEFQEDLKLRAMNDATARKDQEHLEVTRYELNKQTNHMFYFLFFSRKWLKEEKLCTGK